MRKRKRRSKKKLDRDGRLADAAKWLRSRARRKTTLIEGYTQRYAVSESQAWDELVALGFYDDILIELYEQQGIDWEYKVEALTGEMFVVPEGTQDHEIYEYHPII